MPFANTFWSADYVSGIERLSTQSQLSLGQLHELRSVVFSYMKCFHGSGEALAQIWARGYPHDSSFRVSRGQRMAGSRRVVSRGSPPVTSSPSVASTSVTSSPSTSSSGAVVGCLGGSGVGSGPVLSYDSHDDAWDLDFVFRSCVNNANLHSGHFQQLASAIDDAVLAPLTAFIKTHEPHVTSALSDLHQSYSKYSSAYTALDAVRQQYTTTARLGDFGPGPGTGSSSGSGGSMQDQEDIQDSHASSPNSPLEFPLSVPGVIEFANQAELSVFLQNIISSVPITKRKIPLPGYSNDIFCAEHLCDSFIKKRPKGFNPTRSNTEKLGQALLDWKLIVGTGFFAKKFTSGNMWFQWSDTAVQLSLNSGQNSESSSQKSSPKSDTHGFNSEVSSPNSKKSAFNSEKAKSLDDTLSNLSLSTSKRFSGVLKTMSTFGKPQYSEQELLDLEQQYNECYEAFSTHRHDLEAQILNISSHMERFERAKINLIYNTLATLNHVLSTHLQNTSQAARDNAARFQEFNTPEAHLAELQKTTHHFSSGIYFPSLLVPDPTPGARPASTSNIQNIKLNFNLFKDVAVQLKSDDPAPSRRSIPLFLFEAVKLLEKKPSELTAHEWMQPISFEKYWEAKNELVELIQDFELESAVNVQNEAAVEASIIMACIQHLSNLDLSSQVNFLKNWLLEIGDSVIPSTVYDSLISLYKLKSDTSPKMAETTRILGTIPRGNLSSLVFLLDHVSNVFELEKRKEQEEKDESRESDIQKVAVQLNSMETLGAIPFVHVIMRPSVVKHKSGFKPPIQEYTQLLSILLQQDCRQTLFQTLLANEEQYDQRQEQQKQALELQKRNLALQREQQAREQQAREKADPAPFPHVALTPAESGQKSAEKATEKGEKGHRARRSSENDGLKPENFALRPFRTGATPRASPSASPVNRGRSRSIEVTALPKTVITPLDLDQE